MRKILFSLLLATTVATPALAQRHHDSSDSRDESRPSHSEATHDHVRADRSEMRANRAEARANVQTRSDMHVGSPAAGQAVARERVRFGGGASANVNERGRPTLGNDREQAIAAWQDRSRGEGAEQQQQAQRQQVQQRRQSSRQREDMARQRVERQGDRSWQQTSSGSWQGRQTQDRRTASRDDRNHRWDRNWRNDHRYDWRNYRNRHRSMFHLGFYYDPFGYGYQRYNIGFNLRPNYYSSNYWLNDPSMYALPYAPFPYRWVRYYNDALLVNTYTGQVADVIYDFFW